MSLDVPDGEQPGARVPSPRLHRRGARPLVLILTGRQLQPDPLNSFRLFQECFFA